jgi:hypothetical protein
LVLQPNKLDTRVGGDPIAVGSGLSVNTGVSWVSAAIAPRDNTVEVSAEVEGTARVTLARVNTTLFESSADLVGGNSSEAGVSIVAGSSVEDGDDDLQEDIRSESTSGGGAPARDLGSGADGRGGALGQEADGGGVGIPSEGVGHFPEGDVVLKGEAAVVLVDDDAGNVVGGSGVGALEGAGDDSDTRGALTTVKSKIKRYLTCTYILKPSN